MKGTVGSFWQVVFVVLYCSHSSYMIVASKTSNFSGLRNMVDSEAGLLGNDFAQKQPEQVIAKAAETPAYAHRPLSRTT